MSNLQLETVQQYYTKAQTFDTFVKNILAAIKDELELQPRQIAYADSFCSDELCSMQFPQNEMIGPFKLGGLGGYPFSKQTGMTAFSGHIPDDGAALIFYGPHIGITEDSNIGNVVRAGQTHATNCCGSISAALNRLQNNRIQEDNYANEDYQQKVIEQLLLNEEKRIKESDNSILTATEVIYEAIDRQIGNLVSNTDFACQHIVKAGAFLSTATLEIRLTGRPKVST